MESENLENIITATKRKVGHTREFVDTKQNYFHYQPMTLLAEYFGVAEHCYNNSNYSNAVEHDYLTNSDDGFDGRDAGFVAGHWNC